MIDWKTHIRRRIAPLNLSPTREAEIVEELAQHLQDRYDEQRARGAEDAAAKRDAFAQLALLARQLADVEARAPRDIVSSEGGGSMIAGFRRDVRYGSRVLRKNLRFTASVVLTLALGIGANTAIFSVVYSVLLRPLPFPEPWRLVQVWGSKPSQGWAQSSLSDANFWDMRAMSRSFDELGASRGMSMTLLGLEFPERVDGAQVTVGFFRALRPAGVVGRLFVDGEDDPGRAKVAMLSHRFWQRRFGSDPALVGRSLTLSGQPYTVVGILPAGTPWLDLAEVFVPLVHVGNAQRGSFELLTIGRLKPGVTIDAARNDLLMVARTLAERYPADNAGMGAVVESSSTWIAGDTLRRALWILLGSVGFLLLIACVNVANLLLARGAGRAREHAVRLALGATRRDLIRQTLVESLLHALLASAAGLAIAVALLRLFQTLSPGGIPRLAETDLNGWVLAFTMASALATCLTTGLIPALQSPGRDVVPSLREGERGMKGTRSQARTRSVLVAAEVALSLVLLVGAGLLVRSLGQVLGVDRGFETANRLVVAVNIPGSYKDDRGSRIIVNFLSRAASLPDVVSAGAVSGRPLARGSTGLGIGVLGAKDDATGEVPWASWRLVTTDYFKTLGVPLLRGRTFTERDTMGKPWRAIVSQRVAERLWPGRDPIGQTMVLWKGQTSVQGEVIGVVGNMRERGLENEPTLAVYFPFYGGFFSTTQFVIHTTGEPPLVLSKLRAMLTQIDPTLPISNVATLDDVVARSVASRRFTMILLAALAVLAVVLAAGGIYSVLAYSVSRRTAELGVRLALGASRPGLLRLVVSQGMRPVAAGLVIGLMSAAALSRLMTTLLFGVTAGDPWTYASTALVLAIVAAVACYLPARRATQIDPVTALRYE